MKMQNTEMEFVAFDAQDVIATSGDDAPTLTISNFGDSKNSNGSMMGSNGVEFYTPRTRKIDFSSLNALFGFEDDIKLSTAIKADDNNIKSIEGVSELDYDSKGSVYNGVYVWIAKQGRFERKQ